MEDRKSRLQQMQEEVEEVTQIMLDDMKKAKEMSSKLEDVEQRAEVLLEKSKDFEKTTYKLMQQKAKKKRNFIFISIVVVGALVILGLTILAVVVSLSGS